MFLAVCGILFFISCYVYASGKDWEIGQWLADWRTDRIITAIGGASEEITSSYKYAAQEQIDYWERFREDMKNEQAYEDSHGRMFRKRLVYGPNGDVIAEEVVQIDLQKRKTQTKSYVQKCYKKFSLR